VTRSRCGCEIGMLGVGGCDLATLRLGLFARLGFGVCVLSHSVPGWMDERRLFRVRVGVCLCVCVSLKKCRSGRGGRVSVVLYFGGPRGMRKYLPVVPLRRR
jgi:hypothetical protein